MAYGKRSKISNNLNDYSIMIMGESGIGKTTLMAEVCEELFGEDGYMLLNCGKEDGMLGLDGYTYDDVETYKDWDLITRDIIKNKDKDYPELKILVVDTLDELLGITATKIIDDWNREHQNEKNFKKAKTLNAVEGGFGAGSDLTCKTILDRVWALKKKGVRVWYTAHTKQKESIDALTSQSYVSLTSNLSQRDFNNFKTKVQLVGIACMDRTIETEGTGRKNIVTKKEITINKVKEEKRKIVFRDDNYSVDGKSRFCNIVNEIPLDTELFIQALKDAIEGSKRKNKAKIKASKNLKEEDDPNVDVQEDNDLTEEVTEEIDDVFEEVIEDNKYPDDLVGEISKLFKALKDKELKKEVSVMIKEYGRLPDCPEEVQQEIYNKLTEK